MESIASDKRTGLRRAARALLAITLLLALALTPARAAGVVGNGSPGSCTEAALEAALAGGGLVSFNCGPDPHTIVLTSVKTVSSATEVDGGGLITLSGGNSVPHFQVNSASLTLRGITLSRGNGSPGSIENFATLNITNSLFTLNNASSPGGAIRNYGTLTIEDSILAHNTAVQDGGAIYNSGGLVSIHNTQVFSNTTQTNAGGIGNVGGDITITGSSIVDNQASLNGGGLSNNGGQLTINGGTIAENLAANFGGGIFNDGQLNINGVLIERNEAEVPYRGGGFFQLSGTAVLDHVTLRTNRADIGGGISIHEGDVDINFSSLIANHAVFGGAVNNSGLLTLTNSLVYSNTAIAEGAGIYNYDLSGGQEFDPVRLVNVTISENHSIPPDPTASHGLFADNGHVELINSTVINNGGYGIRHNGTGSTITIENTILAGHPSGNCHDGITSAGFNISSDDTCALTLPGDRPETDPLLEPLADNGGPTLSYMPQPGSPAIDGGQCLPGVETDQRGFPRFYGEACDVGAVEVQPRPLYLPLLGR